MATGNFVLDKGFRVPAATVITKFRAVKLHTVVEHVVPVAAVGDATIGVAQIGVTSAEQLRGKGTDVRLMGITEMEISEAVAIGDLIVLAADGRAAVTPTAGDRVCGLAMTAGGTAGDRVTVFWFGAHRLFTTGS